MEDNNFLMAESQRSRQPERRVVEFMLKARKVNNGIFLEDRGDSVMRSYFLDNDRLVNSNLLELSFIPEYAERGITNLMMVCSRGYISILISSQWMLTVEGVNKKDVSGKTAVDYLFEGDIGFDEKLEMFDILFLKGAKVSEVKNLDIPLMIEWKNYNRLIDLAKSNSSLFSTVPKEMNIMMSTLLYLSNKENQNYLSYLLKFYDSYALVDYNYLVYILEKLVPRYADIFIALTYLKKTSLLKYYIERYISENGIDKFRQLYTIVGHSLITYACPLIFIAIYNEDIETINYLLSLKKSHGFSILDYEMPKNLIVASFYTNVYPDINRKIDFLVASIIRNNTEIYDLHVDHFKTAYGKEANVYNNYYACIAIFNSNPIILSDLIILRRNSINVNIYNIKSYPYFPNMPYYKDNYSYFNCFGHFIYCVIYGFFDTPLNKVSNIRIIKQAFPFVKTYATETFYVLGNYKLCMARDTILNQFLISNIGNIDNIRFIRIHTMSQFVSYNTPEIQQHYKTNNQFVPLQ